MILTKNEMIRLIDNATHTHRDRIHTSLVHSNTRTTVFTLIIATVFLVGLMVSCEDPELAPFVPSTITRQHITLQNITPRTIQTHNDFLMLETNQAEEKHIYNVYRLPSADAGTLELTLTLKDPDYKESDLKDITFLLVTSNTSTIERSFSSILPPLKHVTGTAPNPNDVQFSKSPSPYYSKTDATVLVAKETRDYSTLVEYGNPDPSERTFKFRKNEAGYRNIPYNTTLYVKKEATIKGRIIHMLFWVQDGKDKLKGISKINTIAILQKLADAFLKKPDGIYQKMYDINGGHIWDYDDSLKDNAASKDPAEIHIGIGKIQKDSKNNKEFLGGFVTPYVAFKDTSKLFLSGAIEEEYYAPTVYLSIEYLNNIRNVKKKFDMYSTLTHELQHIAAYSLQRLQKPQYSNGRLVIHNGSQWFNELFAVSIEHILGYDLVQAIGGDPTKDLFTFRGREYYSRLIKNEIITQYGLAPPDDSNGLDASVYELHRVFSMYLFNNYGIDVLRNVMSIIDKKDGSAIFEAIENTEIYKASDEKKRPKNFSEVVNDFYVSILLSDTAYLGDGNPTSILTFFAPDITIVPIKSDKGSIAQYGLTTLPDNGSPSPYKVLTFNLINANIAGLPTVRKQPSNRSGIMPTSNLWTEGHGPLIDTPKTAQNTVQLSNSQGRFIYLGGRLPKKPDIVPNLAFTVTKDDDKYLQLKLTMTPEVVSSLIIVTKSP